MLSIVGKDIVGPVPSTLLPVPVLVTLTRPLEASVATAVEAVKLENIGCALKVATPPRVTAPAKLDVVPTYSALAIPTPPAVMIEPVEMLDESVARLELIPAANGMRAVVVV
jgi:hypothetical protein